MTSEVYAVITLVVAVVSFIAGVVIGRRSHKCDVEHVLTVSGDGEVYVVSEAPQVLVDLEVSEEDYVDGTSDWR